MKICNSRAEKGESRKKTVSAAILLVCLAAYAASETPPWQKKLSGEFSISNGWVLKEIHGVVAAFWWYPVPNIISFGCSVDYICSSVPLSVNAGLNLPLKKIVPFISAGVGSSLTRGSISHYGGGLRFRLWEKIGIILEYQNYRYNVPDLVTQDEILKAGGWITKLKGKSSGYIGVGIDLPWFK